MSKRKRRITMTVLVVVWLAALVIVVVHVGGRQVKQLRRIRQEDGLLSAGEKGSFESEHRKLTQRLIAAGVQLGEASAVTVSDSARHGSGKASEFVLASDAALVTEFDSETKEIVYVVNRAAVASMATRHQSGIKCKFELKADEAKDLMHRYYVAITGKEEPVTPVGLRQSFLTKSKMAARADGMISASEEIHERMPRVYSGYPFINDRTELSISAVDGAFLQYHRIHEMDEPKSVTVNLSSKEALERGKAAVAKYLSMRSDPASPAWDDDTDAAEKMDAEERAEEIAARAEDAKAIEVLRAKTPEVILKPMLVIVRPNEEYRILQSKSMRDESKTSTRLAWDMTFFFNSGSVSEIRQATAKLAPRAWSRLRSLFAKNSSMYVMPPDEICGLIAEIWIDSEDGSVLGGLVAAGPRDENAAILYQWLNEYQEAAGHKR